MNLNNWKRDWTLMSIFFNGDEIVSIIDQIRGLKPENLVFCSFENRFAKSGGLASVTTNIIPYLKETNGMQKAVLLTPFHSGISDINALKETGLNFTIPFQNEFVNVEILEHAHHYMSPCSGVIKEYYLKAEGYFNAKNQINDPYNFSPNENINNTELLKNALFFCKAVPEALKALSIIRDIVLHLHEWQTAMITLSAKEAIIQGTLESCGTVLTIHNSYDAVIPQESLKDFVKESRRNRIDSFPIEEFTAFQIALQLVDAPVTTVSTHFAEELTGDLVQSEHYAPHLQRILNSNGIHGINNGMFTAFPKEYRKHEQLTLEQIKKIKVKHRKSLIKVLSTYHPDKRFGDLTYQGRTISKLPDNVPIIVMSGRLDPIQKGYYVLLRALEKFAEDEIKAVLTPLPVRESDLDYFYEVACKCKGNVTVFPMKMQEGYHELQSGSTFGVMPSIYEPFGAAVEYMVNGTVNIGRHTGGLVDQIDHECGYHFREDAIFYNIENINNYVGTADTMQSRKLNPWAQSMADNLYDVMKKAIHTFQHEPDDYYGMIQNGFKKAETFTWEKAAKEYFEAYKLIAKA
ncbi:MAG: glycogen/starch synthase [Nitrospira sp.]|nr:glycogen/starch synthase [Nitrospira sp.]